MYKYNLGIGFEEIVEQRADNAALKFSKKESISYRELNKTANQIARYLIALGIRQHDVVCIEGVKNVCTFACMIGCLKIGAVYVILDPESPTERLRRIMSTCLPKILFIEYAFEPMVEEIKRTLEVIVIHNEPKQLMERINQYGQNNLDETSKVTGINPAYIMYTSGSTGFPKGAVMTHQNVLNLIDWSIETFKIIPEDTLTNVNPLYFDNSVFDFYSSIFSGASLVPLTKETVTNPRSLIDAIDELECTLWFSVPTLLIFLQTMKALNESNLKHIRRFIFGGEGYPKSKLKKLYDIYSDKAELFNVYGPTECTCICSSYKITADDFHDLQGFPPLGEMIANFSYLILDENSQKVPANEIGELCLLGSNVGKGYYNDHARTQASFIQNPYNTHYSEIMYKTGDMVRYNPEDNKIYIVGRKDNQIKHMGYRIELEEIETALSSLDYISQAAVLHGNSRGLSRIIAVVSSKSAIEELQIRNDLKQIIPDYMIPTTFHVLNELPKNPNGKIDRRKLVETYLLLK